MTLLDLLPHRPPMRLVEEIVELVPGVSARTRRMTRRDDWYFQGHFPDAAIVPAVVLVELLAQTGGLAAGTGEAGDRSRPIALRLAAIGPFKFPGGAGAGARLDASARVVGRLAGLYKVEGEVTVEGRVVAVGSLTLAETGDAGE
jgi:3-hydroxyacyl-[acyl-carrier-protein] dehydratase